MTDKVFRDWKLYDEWWEDAGTTAPEVDVDTIKRYLMAHPKPSEHVSVDYVLSVSGLMKWQLVSWSTNNNLEVPLILFTRNNTTYLVDGYHRLSRAIDTKVATLPAIEVTEQECPGAVRL